MSDYSTPRKILYSIIILLGIFLFQELLSRLIFPIPEIVNFNRIDYSPLWLYPGKSGKNNYLMNNTLLMQSEPDDAVFFHTLNLYGFRDKQWKIENDKIRILFIGDSFTEGMITNDTQTIPHLFGEYSKNKRKQIETINLGISAANIEEYTKLIIDSVTILEPEEVILILFANDFNYIDSFNKKLLNTGNNYSEFQYNNPWIPRLFQIFKRLVNNQTITLAWHGNPKLFFKPVPHPSNPWTDRKREYSEYVEEPVAKAMMNGTFNPFLVNRLNKISELRKKIDHNMNDYILFINKYLNEKNIKFSLVYVPDAEMISDYYLSFRQSYAREQKRVSLTDKEYQLQRIYIDKLTGHLGIPFLDLYPYLYQEELSGNHMYWDYDMHMRPAGYKRAAETLYEWWTRYEKDYNYQINHIIDLYINAFDPWHLYADDKGSVIKRIGKLYSNDGNLVVSMKKIADPDPPANKVESYPYVGIGLDFTNKNIDLSSADGLYLTYKLAGKMSLLLSQDGIREGEEYRYDLKETDEYIEIKLRWSDFYQPEFVKRKKVFNPALLSGVKFQITTQESNQAIFGFESITFLHKK